MEITHVKRVSVPVTDQDKAKDFYVNTLGFDLLVEFPVPMGENARWIEVGPKGSATSIILVTWFPDMVPGKLGGLMLETSDFDADCAALAEAGVTLEGPIDTPWGKQATFADPDGNSFVLCAVPQAG
jgi:catechol 2,3-dioxygenase-like lactoylglutathione lyase family enzyme